MSATISAEPQPYQAEDPVLERPTKADGVGAPIGSEEWNRATYGRPEGEWANALTHGIAAAGALALGYVLVAAALRFDTGLAVACGVYAGSVFATFFASTLSHTFRRQPMLDLSRAWDQGMIYAMIAGTYTPIVFHFAPNAVRIPLLAAIWLAALTGIGAKLLYRHRINNVATVTYVMLGWLPAIPMFPYVPFTLGMGMLFGGVVYSVGVLVLINDHRARYLHALWHLMVIGAALCHYFAIDHFVLG